MAEPTFNPYDPPRTALEIHENRPNPFMTIWFRPRTTIRRIIDDDPRKHVIVLAMTCCICLTLEEPYRGHSGNPETYPLWELLLHWLPSGAIVWICMLYAAGLVFWLTGKILGGRARIREIRAALAWGAVPLGLGSILWLITIGIFGLYVFESWSFPVTSQRYWLDQFLWNTIYLSGSWSAVLMVCGVAEAHRFSIVRALICFILGFVGTFVVFVIGIEAFTLFMRMLMKM